MNHLNPRPVVYDFCKHYFAHCESVWATPLSQVIPLGNSLADGTLPIRGVLVAAVFTIEEPEDVFSGYVMMKLCNRKAFVFHQTFVRWA